MDSLPVRAVMTPLDWFEKCVAEVEIRKCIEQVEVLSGIRPRVREHNPDHHAYCYLAVFRPEVRCVAASVLGPHPSIQKLARMPSTWYGDLALVRASRVCGDGYHFGDGDLYAVDVLASYGLMDSDIEGVRPLMSAADLCSYVKMESQAIEMPMDAQVFTVSLTASTTRLYFDNPVYWLFVAGRYVYVDGAVTHVDVRASGTVFVVACGLDKLTMGFTFRAEPWPGICYLTAVRPHLRGEAYGHLGKFPTFRKIAQSGYAVVPVTVNDMGSSAHISGVGTTLLSEAGLQEQVVIGGVREGHVFREYKELVDAVAAGRRDGVLVVYLARSTSVWDAEVVSRSEVVDVSVRDTRVNRKWAADMCLSSGGGTAAAMFPRGCRLVHNGAVYGAADLRVYAIFRDKVRFEILPKVGEYQSGDPPVSVTLLSGRDTKLTQQFNKVIPYKSTDARFLRETGASCVLLRPSVQTVAPQVSDDHIVLVSDPLDDWKKLAVCRWEYDKQRLGSVYSATLPDLTVFKRFRSRFVAALMLAGTVVLCREEASVAVQGKLEVKLVKQESSDVVVVYADGVEPDVTDWSVRVATCADEYCMDNGGPSGSDFSDAI